MKDLTLTGSESALAGPIDDLLSVDADAHLQKLAACIFPSPAQLPVELVRAALKRGASVVDLRVRKKLLTIQDNGNGISEKQWLALACAFDSGREPADREKAIATLQGAASPGIGLLAVYLPGSRRIKVESAGSQGRKTLHIEDGHVELLDSCPLVLGTRISISRIQVGAEAEKTLIRELCAAVPQDIELNGQKLEKKPLLRRTLVQRNIDPSPDGRPATVAIPVRGDVCRIWLLDQGIPWQAYTSAAYHGLIFDAALESDSPPSAAIFSKLAEAAGQLYQWLAAHYLSFPEKFQGRLEELIFKKARHDGEVQLLSAFAPFRLWRSQRNLNLEEVRQMAGNGVLYALPHDSDPGHFLGSHAQALLLTPLQKDFLINHLHIPLVTSAAPLAVDGKLKRKFRSCSRKIAGLAARLPHPRAKILPSDQMDAEEDHLCRELERHWHRRPLRPGPTPPPLTAKVVMVSGRGLAPAFWLPKNPGGVWHIRRRHPLILQAQRCLRSDPDNIELILAALAPDIF